MFRQKHTEANVVIPGATSPSIWSRLAPPPEALTQVEQSVVSSIPLERFGTTDEVSTAVLFLASDDAAPIQAAEIVVNGGMTGALSGVPMYRKETYMNRKTINTNEVSKLRTSMHAIVFQRLASRQLEK
ncbi:hypothetical protein KSD_78520 [Ktedonobacter sp. SOSP1-85]|uniref:SDR family oxidoreductase n=1 Tax=Ktedonobacter sp. SOSP1-85 TaxID=2778367 RepID=UPI001915B7AA|nr:SDR family oxidoreductase [Ktedonobacter sp. SOSP1-85]GHO80081.1 hypothetical protein KSD_78520 [Ktedonobacter sp. SOSP1-85]